MISTLADLLGPSFASALPTEQLAQLSRLKNGIIGQNQRKLSVLRSGRVGILVQLVSRPGGTTEEESLELCIRAVTILGALSLPIAEATAILLSASTQSTLLVCLTRLAAARDAGAPIPFKLLEALVRSLKSLYVDLVKVVGPRAWGTDVIGASVGIGERKDVEIRWDISAAKLKGREDLAMDGVVDAADCAVSTEVPDLQALSDRAIREVYEVIEIQPDTGPLYPIKKRVPSRALKLLMEILSQCASMAELGPGVGDGLIPSASTLRIADMICSFLAGTVRLPYQRLAVVGEAESAVGVTLALYRLIKHGNGKVQEAALNALSALCRDFRRLAMLLTTGLHQIEGWSIIDVITELTQSSSPSLRLAAVTTRTILFKTLRSNPAMAPESSGEPLVPVLLGLIENEPTTRANATFTFAHLIADSEVLQELAVKQRALDVLRDVLQQPPRIQQPYPTTSSLEESARVREGALLAIACIAASLEPLRHQILDTRLLPIIVSSLSHDSVGVRAAACHCLRGLGRSVNVLKTSLVEIGAAKPVYDLLSEGEDLIVQITAAAAIANMLLEFSPARQMLLDLGCMARICHLVQSPDRTLRVNALGAIKNASYLSTRNFKRSLLDELGWDYLAEMICDPNEDIAKEALAILRNLTVGIGEEPLMGLREMGEDRMLSLMERSLCSKSEAIIEQAVYVIVNCATADEGTKLALVARTQLLHLLNSLLKHPVPTIRVAVVWVMINLTHRERAPRFPRKPVEIVMKLRAVGVEQILRTMMDDDSLDVRERVRQALDQFAGTPTPGR